MNGDSLFQSCFASCFFAGGFVVASGFTGFVAAALVSVGGSPVVVGSVGNAVVGSVGSEVVGSVGGATVGSVAGCVASCLGGATCCAGLGFPRITTTITATTARSPPVAIAARFGDASSLRSADGFLIVDEPPAHVSGTDDAVDGRPALNTFVAPNFAAT